MIRRYTTSATALLLCVLPYTAARAADPVELSFPLRCELGATCFVQSYVDHDASSGSRDYRCGSRTYDGHSGTDFRVLDLAMQRSGVEVLAAASGRVSGLRDGMEDISVRTVGKAAIAGKECGNGVVLEHGNGWQTQYCHMTKGSVRVKAGDRVSAGQPLGLVGLSGDTEFPHLHLTVRSAGATVDPFAFGPPIDSCGSSGRSLWKPDVDTQLAYRARQAINYGFAAVPPTMETIESGDVKKYPPDRQSDALVAYIRAIGLQKGDEQILTINAPDGGAFAEYTPPTLESNKAQNFISVGKKRTTPSWPQGIYVATYRVKRDGVELLQQTFEMKIE